MRCARRLSTSSSVRPDTLNWRAAGWSNAAGGGGGVRGGNDEVALLLLVSKSRRSASRSWKRGAAGWKTKKFDVELIEVPPCATGGRK